MTTPGAPPDTAPVRTIALEIDAVLSFQAAVDEFFRASFQAVPATAQENLPGLLQLVVSELFTNVARHAYPEDAPGRVRIEATIWPELLELRVTDHGAAFDPGAIPEPDPESLRTGGYGLFIIRSQMDTFTYTSSPSENVLRLTRKLR